MIAAWKIPFFLLSRYMIRGNKSALSLTIFLMAIAFINLVFVAALFNGIVRGSDDQVIDTFVGHVTIGPPEGEQTIDHVQDELAKVQHTPGVVGASPQTTVLAAMRYRDITITREILAIDPELERTVTNIPKELIEGSYLQPDDTSGIVIGLQIAGGPNVELNSTSFKGAHAGDSVSLIMGGAEHRFVIRGVFHTKLLQADSRAFITQRALNEMDARAKDRATMIIVRAHGRGLEHSLIEALRANGVQGTFGTWQDAAGIMKSVTKSFGSIDVLLSSVGLLISAVTIFIVIYIDIAHRQKEIGVLRAIGVSAWLIRATYVLRSGAYAIAGVLLGSGIFFAIITPYFAAHPFSLPICDAVLVIKPIDFVGRAGTVVLVAMASGLIPAFLVTRMNVMDAVRGR